MDMRREIFHPWNLGKVLLWQVPNYWKVAWSHTFFSWSVGKRTLRKVSQTMSFSGKDGSGFTLCLVRVLNEEKDGEN